MLTRPAAMLAAAAAWFTPSAEAPTAPPPSPLTEQTQATLTPEQLCEGDAACLNQRWILVNYAALGVEVLHGERWLSYDYDEVTRALPYTEFEGESELSLAVRLIISEVGADRLLTNRYGLQEAIGILYTVDNRLNPFTNNPSRFARFHSFPGCGLRGDFMTCANAAEYIGMDTWRAVDPSSRYRAGLLEPATDLAVVAWHLQEEGLVPDTTGRATSYIHRCGGAAYGRTTWHCDGTNRRGIPDMRGANPVTGPIVFKRPVRDGRRRAYTMEIASQVDYEAIPDDTPHLVERAVTPFIRSSDDGMVEAE